MGTGLYYVSGTGNSLHVARELQTRIPDAELVPIVHLLHRDTIKTSAGTVGFVFPNFCLTVPIPMHEFLKKVDLASAQYIFAVCTRGGTPSEAFDYINEMLGKQGKKLNAQLDITMPWNHPMGKEDLIGSNSQEQLDHLESQMQSKLDELGKHILAHKAYVKEDTDATYKIPRWMTALNSLIPKSFNYESHRYMYQNVIRFYSDSTCTGCSVCEKVCLSHKIELVGKKPVWKEDVTCYGCFACINFCPQQAMQIESRPPLFRSYTDVHGRYHHPSVAYKDIAEQR